MLTNEKVNIFCAFVFENFKILTTSSFETHDLLWSFMVLLGHRTKVISVARQRSRLL